MPTIGRAIFRLRRSRGWDQNELARALQVSQATVSRWEADAQEPKADALRKLSKLAGVSVDTFIGNTSGAKVGLTEVPVVGDVEAGVARESYEWPVEDRYSVAAPPDPRYPGLPRFGLVIKGESMNQLYPNGTVVICIRAVDLARSALPGEKAIVCKRATGGIEATCKEIRIEPDGSVWAWPRSDRPEHQAPLRLTNDGDDGDPDVWIDAIVVGSYRLE